METVKDDKYKDMSVEDIITELYEENQKDKRACATLAKRSFLGAVIAAIVGVAMALYHWLGNDASWHWFIIVPCALIAAGCWFMTLLSLLPLGIDAKYAIADFHILVERALKLKYGEATPEMVDQYMLSPFVQDFIAEIQRQQNGGQMDSPDDTESEEFLNNKQRVLS